MSTAAATLAAGPSSLLSVGVALLVDAVVAFVGAVDVTSDAKNVIVSSGILGAPKWRDLSTAAATSAAGPSSLPSVGLAFVDAVDVTSDAENALVSLGISDAPKRRDCLSRAAATQLSVPFPDCWPLLMLLTSY